MHTVLALDIATKTGWVVAIDGHIVESGTWNFAKKKADHEFARLTKFQAALDSLKDKYPIDTVVWERVDFARFVKAHAMHNKLLAVLELWIMENDLYYSSVPVISLKRYATGSGRAKKDDMLNAALDKWPDENFDAVDDNEIDARWVLDYHLNNGK